MPLKIVEIVEKDTEQNNRIHSKLVNKSSTVLGGTTLRSGWFSPVRLRPTCQHADRPARTGSNLWLCTADGFLFILFIFLMHFVRNECGHFFSERRFSYSDLSVFLVQSKANKRALLFSSTASLDTPPPPRVKLCCRESLTRP